MRTMNKIFSMLYMLSAVCLTLTLAPLPAPAATVDYSAGNFEYVVGNPANPGEATGIGGTDTEPEENANASGNTVNVTGGTVDYGVYGGYHRTTTGDATAKDNQVNIFNGPDIFEVTGGYAGADTLGYGYTADASGNSVSVDGGTFNQIWGGHASPDDGPAAASDNTVNLTGVSVRYLAGGIAMVYDEDSTAVSTANSNTVIVTDSSVTSDFYGGRAGHADSQQSFVHNDNSVTLAGDTDVTGFVYGGAPDYSGADLVPDYNNGTGNTLNVRSPKSGGITVGGNVQFFQNYSFDLTGAAAGATMLKVAGTAYIQDAAVTLAFDGTAPSLAVNDEITLINGAAIDGEFAEKSVTVSGYTFALSLNGSALTAKQTAVPAGPDIPDIPDNKTGGSSGCDAGAGMAGMLVLAAALTGIRNPLKLKK